MNKALLCGLAVLGGAWLGPLPGVARQLFVAHMSLHVIVIGAAAPLIALGLAHSHFDPVRRWPTLFPPITLALVALGVIWGWHASPLHHWARTTGWTMAVEQLSLFAATAVLWLSVFGGAPAQRPVRRFTGAFSLLLTSMHMTLLGALLTLAAPSYTHAGPSRFGLDAGADQLLGAALMLAAGGLSALLGGLYLYAKLPREQTAPQAALARQRRALQAGPLYGREQRAARRYPSGRAR